MGVFRYLTQFFRKYKWYYFFGIFWLLVVNVVQMMVPRLLGNITDSLAQGMLDARGLLMYALMILGIGLIMGFGRALWRIFITGSARRLEYYLRTKLFAHLQKMSPNYFNRMKTGDLMAHATNDINAVRMAFGGGIIMATDAIVLTLLAGGLMVAQVGWQLTLIAIIPLPILAVSASSFGRIIHSRFKNVQAAFSTMTESVQENLEGARVVKAFVQEDEEIKRFEEAAQKHVDTNVHLVKVWGMLEPLVQVLATASVILIVMFGGRAVINGSISIGDFVAFNSYLVMLIWPMMAIGWVINVLQRGRASMDRLNAILDEQPDIYDGDNAKDVDVQGNIEIKDLSFEYEDGHKALKNINLNIKKGKTVAIIGRTGSGKTTLVNLLLRLANPPRGTIYVDGVDINDIKLKNLRESIGYVPQDNFLFSTDISNNIAFALEKTNTIEVEEAAKFAHIYDNIIEFPEKFDTMVGERGVTLSGGQKQRISIARAIIKDPEILILDDSLSAVDTQTEEEILKQLEDIMNNKTSIIISHRVSTVKDADEIVVMDQGEIVERGNHDELVKQGGLYANLNHKQQLEEKLGSA
ncbi:ABC transporter ATP-binding protein [Proteinivorax tanatarense]|uniref:ABC transporter ATP-binding protein n=1 Tax=Proteinivorax tanatarense TaxID=1260629 RepID=A0AAU7VJ34_9FIRM